jgi:hypothetical protein
VNAKKQLALGLVIVGVLCAAESRAAGRYYSGGHPYHNGFHFMPPASAHEAVRVRPPFRYGVPAYYFPESYLGAPQRGFYPPVNYQYAPTWRAPFYYMSEYGSAYAYPW